MVEQQIYSTEELQQKIADWLANGGGKDLAEAIRLAAITRSKIAESLRIDYDTLHQPMTI